LKVLSKLQAPHRTHEITEGFMITIRLPKAQWRKAWRALIEVAPVRLIAKDPPHEVLPARLEMLNARGSSHEVVRPERPRQEKQRRATSD
jgi:hypothetical protein